MGQNSTIDSEAAVKTTKPSVKKKQKAVQNTPNAKSTYCRFPGVKEVERSLRALCTRFLLSLFEWYSTSYSGRITPFFIKLAHTFILSRTVITS